jgi:hypothetical protein
MPAVVQTPTAPVESMMAHSWLAEDQKAAFSTSQFVPDLVSVSAYLGPWLKSKGLTSAAIKANGLCIRDRYVTSCLMNQALDFLQRALCNTAAQYLLGEKGLETWARVTNYYASYFCVHCLLCLQGRTITTLHLDTALHVQIVPLALRDHEFFITTRQVGRNPHHVTPWYRYYEIYDRYAVPRTEYEAVARKAYVVEPSDEAIERNAINYAPFAGFREIRDLARHLEFKGLFSTYVSDLEAKNSFEEFLADLQGYASDPEHKYFARSLLKFALAGEIIRSIRSVSPHIEAEWASVTQRWRGLLGTVFPDPTKCYLLKFIPLVGSAPN